MRRLASYRRKLCFRSERTCFKRFRTLLFHFRAKLTIPLPHPAPKLSVSRGVGGGGCVNKTKSGEHKLNRKPVSNLSALNLKRFRTWLFHLQSCICMGGGRKTEYLFQCWLDNRLNKDQNSHHWCVYTSRFQTPRTRLSLHFPLPSYFQIALKGFISLCLKAPTN